VCVWGGRYPFHSRAEASISWVQLEQVKDIGPDILFRTGKGRLWVSCQDREQLCAFTDHFSDIFCSSFSRTELA
jgi:hypothetical protein